MVLLQSSMVPLGTPAHDFSLLGTDGKQHSLADYSQVKFLVLIFMCNHCPYVQAIWDDLVALEKRMPKQEVQFLGINANANPNYPEDSYEKMMEYAKKRGQEFPYLFDAEQNVAKAYGAECTPDIFVYDASRQLIYRGSFDGLVNALNDLLNGKEPSKDQKHSMGCSIKWMT